MSLVPGDQISDRIAFLGYYERELSQRVAQLAARGGLMIDVGANLGFFSLLWAAGHAENRCIAVEASPRTVPLLRANVQRNGLAARIEVHAIAAGHEHGTLAFELGPSDQTGWGGFANASQYENTVVVDVVRLDDLVPTTQPIALLKIDTEGADTWVLYGCERLLRAQAIKEIWYEQHQPRMQALGIPFTAAEEFLRSVGYAASPVGSVTGEIAEWRALPQRNWRPM
jgi:FkbM family methyltransferase